MIRKIPTVLFILMISMSCGKKSGGTSGGGTTPTPTEESIVFTISPDPGSTTQSVLGATHTFNVTVTSKLPTSGVTIAWKIVQDANQSSVLEDKNVTSTIASTDINTATLTSGVLYSCTVTVTSKTKATNTANKTFKMSRK